MRYLIMHPDFTNPVKQTDNFNEAVIFCIDNHNCQIFDMDLGEYGGYIELTDEVKLEAEKSKIRVVLKKNELKEKIAYYENKLKELKKKFEESGSHGGWPVDNSEPDYQGAIHEYEIYLRCTKKKLKELEEGK